MSSTKLKNAPLKEVVFELYWEGSVDNGMQIDAGFDLAQGKFADKLTPEFPVHRKLVPDGIPLKIFGTPLHQYWAGEFKWPVIQHGQGMITVNEVEQGYAWIKSYKPLIIQIISTLIESYTEPLKFNRVRLQYVDAHDLNDDIDAMDFVVQNLQTEVVNNYPLPGGLKSFNVQQTFELPDASLMSLNISTGINNQNQKKSVIWTTIVEKNLSMSFDQIKKWIEDAHSASSQMFKKMLNPQFYASLDK